MTLDSILLPVLEVGLLGFAFYAASRDNFGRSRGGGGGVKRGPKAMAYFYGAFAASTATLVGIALNVEAAAGYRVLLVLVNLSVPAYLCFLNGWFRNLLLRWIAWVADEVEK